MLIPKNKPIRSEKHRRWIASLPCVVSGAHDTQAAHIRKGNGCGMGMKPCDSCTLPLSVAQHRLQGEIGEELFWKPYGGHERATQLAKDLFSVSGDRDAALALIAEFRNEICNL